jgi:uncharacterized protein YndB with AHSA1/START domain
MEDRIVQDITINADLERVWDLVTEPGWWVPSDIEEPPDRTPGRQTVRESVKYGRFPVEVVRLDARTHAEFRWASQFPGAELAPGRTTLIAFDLTVLPDGVRVTVTESGFAHLDASDGVREAGLRSNTDGWQEEMASLKSRAEQG